MKKSFSLSLNSLALFRILLGILVMTDFLNRNFHIKEFYSDFGVLPRDIFIKHFSVPWRLTFLSLDGSLTFALILGGIGVLASLFLILGWRTKWAIFICWLLTCTFQTRNPLVNNAGDNLFRMVLFWSMFLPIAARYSLDYILSGNTEEKRDESYFSGWSIAFIIQVCLLYWLTFIYKWNPIWYKDFSSVYYALNLNSYTTPLGNWLSQFITFGKIASFSTLWLELLGPFLLFIPFKNSWFRGMAILSFVSFHLGIWLTLYVGKFSPICIIIWLALIPSDFWDWLSFKISRPTAWVAKINSILINKRVSDFVKKIGYSQIKLKVGRKENLLAIFLILLVVVWNIQGQLSSKKFRVPAPFREIVRVLQLHQKWNMFAPRPRRADGWIIVDGKLKNGENWDIFHNQNVSYERPEKMAEMFYSAFWRKYLFNLTKNKIKDKKYRWKRLSFGKYLCRNWNRSRKNGDRVNTFNVFFMREFTPPIGGPPRPIKKKLLWRHDCFKKTSKS